MIPSLPFEERGEVSQRLFDRQVGVVSEDHAPTGFIQLLWINALLDNQCSLACLPALSSFGIWVRCQPHGRIPDYDVATRIVMRRPQVTQGNILGPLPPLNFSEFIVEAHGKVRILRSKTFHHCTEPAASLERLQLLPPGRAARFARRLTPA